MTLGIARDHLVLRVTFVEILMFCYISIAELRVGCRFAMLRVPVPGVTIFFGDEGDPFAFHSCFLTLLYASCWWF